MNKIVLALVASLVMSGCANMSPGEKNAAYIIGGILIVGAIAAHDSSSSSPPDNCVDVITYPDNSGIYIPPCP